MGAQSLRRTPINDRIWFSDACVAGTTLWIGKGMVEGAYLELVDACSGCSQSLRKHGIVLLPCITGIARQCFPVANKIHHLPPWSLVGVERGLVTAGCTP